VNGFLFPPPRCVDFTFAVFETVSAYGSVGLSLGIPTVRRYAFPVFQSFQLGPGKLFVLWITFRRLQDHPLCCDDQRSTQKLAHISRPGSHAPHEFDKKEEDPLADTDVTVEALPK
jgi:hypothetical protein